MIELSRQLREIDHALLRELRELYLRHQLREFFSVAVLQRSLGQIFQRALG